MVKMEKVVNLIEKIDKKKKELKQLKKDLQNAFNDICLVTNYIRYECKYIQV